MRGSYSGHGVRIFKDAVSLPDVSSQYLLSGTMQGLNALELYAPGIKAYEMMLKGAVVGGPSLDFIRKHGAGKTTIRSHKYKNARMCQQILGYDANALYPSTILQEMPFGPEKVVHYENSAEEVDRSVSRLRRKRWFGFAELDIRVLRELWKKLEKISPLFYNSFTPEEAILEDKKEYLERTKRTGVQNCKLCRRLAGKKTLLYAPLMEWYVDHGLEITAVHRTIDYTREKTFTWFVNREQAQRRRRPRQSPPRRDVQVVGKQRLRKANRGERKTDKGDIHKGPTCSGQSKTSYGSMTWTRLASCSRQFRKEKVTTNRPLRVELVKLRMLQFYYYCLDYFIDRRDFELIRMETDSMYLGFSCKMLEKPVQPELLEEFKVTKIFSSHGINEAVAHRPFSRWSSKEPVRSSSAVIENEEKSKAKLSSKCVSKRQDKLTWDRYEAALNGVEDKATNRGSGW